MKKVKDNKINPSKNPEKKEIKKEENTKTTTSTSVTTTNNNEGIIIEQKENLLKDQDGKVDLSKPIDIEAKKEYEKLNEGKDKLENLVDKEILINKPLSSKESEVIKNSVITEKYTPISTYNGDSCDEYNWSQGTTDVQIQIKLPEKTGAKQVKTIKYILIII